LPKRFVEQQVTALARAGIVTCRRGATGGCALARPASRISVLEVVEAIQGEVMDVPQNRASAAAEVWNDAAAALGGFLSDAKLDAIALRQRELDAAAAPMYYI